MPKTEDEFLKFLKKHKIRYETQYKIRNIPFNSRGYHLVDFYLPGYKLYIEVKGFMTLFQVNVLKYLLKYRKEKFYVLQVTEEDWIEPYNQSIHFSKRNKIEMNKRKQYKEILKLVHRKLTNTDLQNRSMKRLKRYVECRNNDITNWI